MSTANRTSPLVNNSAGVAGPGRAETNCLSSWAWRHAKQGEQEHSLACGALQAVHEYCAGAFAFLPTHLGA